MGSTFPIPKHTPQLEVKMKIFLTSLLFSAIVSMTWARGCHTELKTVWKTEFKETEEEKCQTINEEWCNEVCKPNHTKECKEVEEELCTTKETQKCEQECNRKPKKHCEKVHRKTPVRIGKKEKVTSCKYPEEDNDDYYDYGYPEVSEDSVNQQISGHKSKEDKSDEDEWKEYDYDESIIWKYAL